MDKNVRFDFDKGNEGFSVSTHTPHTSIDYHTSMSWHTTILSCHFQNEWFDALEGYLANRDERSRLMPEDANTPFSTCSNSISPPTHLFILRCKVLSSGINRERSSRCVGGDMEFEQVLKGVLAGINLINTVRGFLAHSSRFAKYPSNASNHSFWKSKRTFLSIK